MSDEVKETIIEFESVKKGRKAIFFVLIGLFVLTTVAFMLLWILKPQGSSVGVQDIVFGASDIKSVGTDADGNPEYIASVGGQYTLSADVALIGEVDAESAVEWSVSPSDAVNIISTGVDPDVPNRSVITFAITSNAINTDGTDKDVTIRATSPFGKNIVKEFKFKARANYAAEGRIESVMFGDRKFTPERIDDQHYSVEVPYFSTDISNPDMFMFTVNVSQFAAKAENGEYLELSRGIAGTDGKQIDNIRYSVESADGAAEVAYQNMNGESTFIRILKAGKATVKATLNAYNSGAELPIFLEITAKDITKYDDVLSSVRFKRSDYTLFLHESRQEDLFDLQDEIVFSKDPPTGRTWEYDVYESDVSGNPPTNRKLNIVRSYDQNDQKTVITMGPLEGAATVGNTYITVKDKTPGGYGVSHTVPVKMRNPVYSESGNALSVAVGGETEVSEYQGDTFDINVTYKLRDYDGTLTADNITSELYFYYTNPAHAPQGNNFTNVVNAVTLSGMSYAGEITVEEKTTRIYSVSPAAIKINNENDTATATIRAKIGGVTPSSEVVGKVGINFVTFPQSSHYDPDILNSYIIEDGGDDVYVAAEPFTVNVLETVSSMTVKSDEDLKSDEILSDGSRFFAHGGKNNYRLVRPVGVTTDSRYSLLDLFEYKGTKGDGVNFENNVPENLTVEVKSGDDVLTDGYKLAGSTTETTLDPAVIEVTLTTNGGKTKTVYTIELYYKVVIKEAELPITTVINSTYKLEADAYDGNNYGFVSFDNGRILNFPNVVTFRDWNGALREDWKTKIERYILIDQQILVKKKSADVTGGGETMAYYFYLPSQITDGAKPLAAEALFKMNGTGDIAVNRDLYAFMKNNTDIHCNSVNVVYSAYELKYEKGKFVVYDDDWFGREEYNDLKALENGKLMAARVYVNHRGFDSVRFNDGLKDDKKEVNVGSSFDLLPVGIIKYYDKTANGGNGGLVEEVAVVDKARIGDFEVQINSDYASKIETVNAANYQYRVKDKQVTDLTNVFTVSAKFTRRNGETNEDYADETRIAQLSLKVLDMYLPVKGITAYRSEENAEALQNPVSNGGKFTVQFDNAGSSQSETLYLRVDYIDNTTYSYLAGLSFAVTADGENYSTAGNIDQTFAAFIGKIEDNPSESSPVLAEDKTYHIVKLTLTPKTGNTLNKKYSFVITPQVKGEQIPNQTAELTFDLDVTTYANGAELEKSNGADRNSTLVKDGANYNANMSLNVSGSGVTAPGAMTIDVSPTVNSGFTADDRNIKVTVNSDESKNADFFNVSASGNKVTVTPYANTCLNNSFDVILTETRYLSTGTSWEETTEIKRVTVFVNITTDIYKVAFDDTSAITVNVTGGSGTSSANFSATYNDDGKRDLNSDDGLEYVLSDYKNDGTKNKLNIVGNSLIVDNDLGACTVTLTARSKKHNSVFATKTVHIVSLDKTLSFKNFVHGGGADYTAKYEDQTTAAATVDITYFGAKRMDFALNDDISGNNYKISYAITQGSGVTVDNGGVVTWTADGVNRFTLTARVTITSGGVGYVKTLTATVIANARAASFDGLNAIKGYTGADTNYVYVTAYEGATIDLNGLIPKDSGGNDAADIGYAPALDNSVADHANGKINLDDEKKIFTVSALDPADENKFAYVKITAHKHAKDTVAQTAQYSVTLKIELKDLTDDDKTLTLMQGNTEISGDTVNAGKAGESNVYTAEFKGNNVIEKLVKVYGATVEYSLSATNGAASIRGNTVISTENLTLPTVTVNSVTSGSFIVTAIVKMNDAEVFRATLTKNVVSNAALAVKYGTTDNIADATDDIATPLNIGYTGDAEKFVFVFVSYADFAVGANEVKFTPYISGVNATLDTTYGTNGITHDTANKRFAAKYKITPVAYSGATLKTDLGTATLGGTINFGGFDYTATKTVDLTATKPTVTMFGENNADAISRTLADKGTATLNTSVGTENSADYTVGTNYTITYEMLSDGNLSADGSYGATGNENVLTLNSAAGNSTAVTFTAKSFVDANGKIITYAKNSIKLRVKVNITKGIYAGYTTEKIVTVTATDPGALPEISLDKTALGDKFSTEYNGIVLKEVEDKITLYASSVGSGLDILGSAFNVNIQSGTTYSIKNSNGQNDYRSEKNVALSSNCDYGYELTQIGKDTVTVNITITSGAYSGAKVGVTFDVYHLPVVDINGGNVREFYATDGYPATITVSAATVDAIAPVLTLRADNGLGYVIAGDTAGEFKFVPTANASGDVNVKAYATYNGGDFAGRTVESQYSVTVHVLSAKFKDTGATTGNRVSGGKIYVKPDTVDTEYDLATLTAEKLGNGAGDATNFSLEPVSGAYDAGKISFEGKKLKVAVDANTDTDGGIEFTNAVKITIRESGKTYVGYVNIIIEKRALDAEPSALTYSGSNQSYTPSLTIGDSDSAEYAYNVEQGASVIDITFNNRNGNLSFARKSGVKIENETPVVISVTATITTRCYGVVTRTAYITATIEPDPLPTLDIGYNSTTQKFTVSATAHYGENDNSAIEISNVTLSGGADGFKILPSTTNVFEYEYIANENATITFAASAVVNVSGNDHNGKTITVSKEIRDIVPTQSRLMPEFDITKNSAGSYALSVKLGNAAIENKDIDYSVVDITGGEVLSGDSNEQKVSINRNNGNLTFTAIAPKTDTQVVIRVSATVTVPYYGEVTLYKEITETVKGVLDPEPTLDITYNSTAKTFTVTFNSKGVSGVSMTDVILSGNADGFTLGSGNNGVFTYTFVADDNATITFIARAKVVGGDHKDKIITVSKEIEVVPTKLLTMPTIEVGSGYTLSVKRNGETLTAKSYSAEATSGGDALNGAVTISADNKLVFTPKSVKVDTQVVIRISATVTVPYDGEITLYKDIEITVTKTDAPVLAVTNSADNETKVNTITVTANTSESGVTLENIDIIIENVSGLTTVKTASGATCTLVSDADKTVAYFVTATVKGGVYDGDTITARGTVTLTHTPQEVPEDAPTFKVDVSDPAMNEINEGENAGKTQATYTVTLTSNKNLQEIIFVGLDGANLTENKTVDNNYIYTYTYTVIYDKTVGVGETSFKVFVTVGGGNYDGTVIKDTKTISAIDAIPAE